ncbi:MAG: flagellar biosynthesis protein FliQ [Rhizobiales bacterium]|nr:flagellar biosynthesis protein FliQ [Hyphomicrobiales bacterium]
MTGPEVLDVARDSIWTLLYVSLPVMLTGLVVGLVVALVQALTQIQELTLVFIPKIIAMFIVALLTLPFVGAVLASYTDRVFEKIISG